MRVQQLQGQEGEDMRTFSDYLLRVGEGTEKHYNDYNRDFNYIVETPSIITGTYDKPSFIKKVFPDIEQE